MYANECDCCGGQLPDLADNDDWEAIYSQITKELLEGSAADINTDLMFKTADKLMEGVNAGLYGTGLAYDSESAILANYLQNNIYHFSAAKSLNEMVHFRDLMIGSDGKILGYSAFKKAITEAGYTFNNKYLSAEYNNANYSAIMAHKWDALSTEFLEYSTVGDSRVRPEHKRLDKFTAPKSDPVWNRIYPPLAFGCRCTVVPGKSQNVEKTMTGIEASAMMKPYVKDTIFDNNVGKSKVIFTDKHPYFRNAKGEVHSLSWEQYGLKPLDKIKINPLPEYSPASKEQYMEWWQKQPKVKGNDILIKDVKNQDILLTSSQNKKGRPESYFKEHILKKDKENRFEYGHQTANVLKMPDEIWKNEQGRVYLKYYEQGTLKLIVDDKLEAKTLFRLHDKNSGELNKARKGTLLYKK